MRKTPADRLVEFDIAIEKHLVRVRALRDKRAALVAALTAQADMIRREIEKAVALAIVAAVINGEGGER